MSAQLSTGYIEARNQGAAFADVFQYGCIEIRSGVQPVNADAPAQGTLLARITRNGGLWSAGFASNGLEFVAAGRYCTKNPDHTWRMVGIGTGVAGHFRMVGNASDNGLASQTLPRIDGAIGLVDAGGDAQMRITDTAITPSTNLIVPHWWLGSPPL